MSKIRLREIPEPATPDAGKAWFYVDSADKSITIKRDDGSTEKYPTGTFAAIATSGDYGDLVNNYKAYISATAEITNTTNSYDDGLTLNINVPVTGDYKINVDFLWRYSNGSRNVYIAVELDTNVIWEMAKEPKDTGADIRESNGMHDIRNLAAGLHQIKIIFRSQNNGDTSRLYNRIISVERWQ